MEFKENVKFDLSFQKKSLTYAKKVTVSVLYWYEKLQILGNQEIFDRQLPAKEGMTLSSFPGSFFSGRKLAICSFAFLALSALVAAPEIFYARIHATQQKPENKTRN